MLLRKLFLSCSGIQTFGQFDDFTLFHVYNLSNIRWSFVCHFIVCIYGCWSKALIPMLCHVHMMMTTYIWGETLPCIGQRYIKDWYFNSNTNNRSFLSDTYKMVFTARILASLPKVGTNDEHYCLEHVFAKSYFEQKHLSTSLICHISYILADIRHSERGKVWHCVMHRIDSIYSWHVGTHWISHDV